MAHILTTDASGFVGLALTRSALDSVAGPLVVAGHSMGGQITMEIVALVEVHAHDERYRRRSAASS